MVWLQAPLVALACWAMGKPLRFPVGAALAFAGLGEAMAFTDREGMRSRIMAGAATVAVHPRAS